LRLTIGTFIQTLITASDRNPAIGSEIPSLSRKTGVGLPSLFHQQIRTTSSQLLRPLDVLIKTRDWTYLEKTIIAWCSSCIHGKVRTGQNDTTASRGDIPACSLIAIHSHQWSPITDLLGSYCGCSTGWRQASLISG